MRLALLLMASSLNASPGPGVPLELVRERAARVSEVRYELEFSVPEAATAPVSGRALVRFRLRDAQAPLALDFRRPEGGELSVAAGGRPVSFAYADEHVLIPAGELKAGDNELELAFTSGDGPLNRRPGYLYTLLVPARARELFPCFDQPDLKARFSLLLRLPAGWTAVANGAEQVLAGAYRFAETRPIPTYLFAFAAGRFSVEEATRGGRRIRFFHLETDAAKVRRNRDAVFDLHARSLHWMEEFAGIPYPFGKLDLVLVPAFQYAGMEHPGAVYYSSDLLLLDESATQDAELKRAGVIAHEVAHQWFGDLVTMRWFDDVWLKEVFANFLAEKMVSPEFPGLDHELRFLLQHQPGAYRVDRTPGAHPILQPLENLSEAGRLYGPIIYQKAPVVMRQLEAAVGAEPMRLALREYLEAFSFGNASWDELVAVLQRRSVVDLRAFSDVWVREPGRPTVSAELEPAGGRVKAVRVSQLDPAGRGRLWPQRLEVVLLGPGAARASASALLQGASVRIARAEGWERPDAVLLDGSGLGYGLFELDLRSRRSLLASFHRLPEARLRAAAWLSLWDAMLERKLRSEELLNAALRALEREPDELLAQRLLADVETLLWRLVPERVRARRVAAVEELLWKRARAASSPREAAAFARTYRSIATTPAGLSRLERLWRGAERIEGLTLGDDDKTDLVLELAVRGAPSAPALLEAELRRLSNPERRARLEFLLPALSADTARRDAFFAGLSRAENRRREAWVEDALLLLHHPLRRRGALKYLPQTFERLEEVAATGDIFFPAAWVDASLRGHNEPEAASELRAFLARRPAYPERLARLLRRAGWDLETAAALSAR